MESLNKSHHEAQDHHSSLADEWLKTMAEPTKAAVSTSESSTPADETTSAEKSTESALTDIARWRERYDDEEADFIHFAAHVNLGDPTSHQKYLNWLQRSEESASFCWQQMINSTNNALSQRVISGAYQTAQAQNYGRNIDPTKSIEASSAVFFDERMDDLRDCINSDASLTDEERKKRLFLLRNTWHQVENYVFATSDSYSDYEGQRIRRNAHNNMVKQLNTLNDLARHYDTTPLTFRNFMTNDFVYDSSRDRSGALDHKAEYDRETVATYFFNAFATDLRRLKEQQDHAAHLFR